MDGPTHRERALEVARQRGVARGRDFDAAGVPRTYLQRLRDEGALLQVGRGLYRLAGADTASAGALAEATRIQPRGVIGLLSALQVHGLTTQTPHAVWMLLAPSAWAPINSSIRIKVVRASREALTEGVEIHVIDGVETPITSPAKTVADCFKHRNKIGLDVAIEALRDFMASPGLRAQRDDLWRYAKIDRVQAVMRPYIEALTS